MYLSNGGGGERDWREVGEVRSPFGTKGGSHDFLKGSGKANKRMSHEHQDRKKSGKGRKCLEGLVMVNVVVTYLSLPFWHIIGAALYLHHNLFNLRRQQL